MLKHTIFLIAVCFCLNCCFADPRNLNIGFYENQTKFLTIEELTGTKNCTFNLGDLNVKDANSTWPQFIHSQNLITAGYNAINFSELTVQLMKTNCNNSVCAIYVIDSNQVLYQRYGTLQQNGIWVPGGDANLSNNAVVAQDKFTSVITRNDVTFTLSVTEKNTTRFIVGLKPTDTEFSPSHIMVEVNQSIPEADVEYFKQSGKNRSFVVLERKKDGSVILTVSFIEKPIKQNPEIVSMNASSLNLTTIYAIRADPVTPNSLFVFADTSLLAYDVSDMTNWTLLANYSVSITKDAAAAGYVRIERLLNYLVLVSQGNKTLSVYDISKLPMFTQTGWLKVDATDSLEIDFSSKLGFLYVTIPTSQNFTQLTVYDIKLLKDNFVSPDARRFQHSFTNANYSQVKLFSVANLDSTADAVFWHGIFGDVYKLYKKPSLRISVGSEISIFNDTALIPGPRQGTYIFNYAFDAAPFCEAVTEAITINLTLSIILPMRSILKNTTQENQSFEVYYPGLLFDGPTTSLTFMKDPTDQYAGKYDFEVIPPLKSGYRTPRLVDEMNEVLVESFTDLGRAFLLISNSVGATTAYKVTTVSLFNVEDSVSYFLNKSDSSWTEVDNCYDLKAIKDTANELGFVVACTLKDSANTTRLYLFPKAGVNSTQSPAVISAASYQEILRSELPFANSNGKNVLFQVFDSDENNGVFLKSILAPLPGLEKDPKYELLYSQIKSSSQKGLGQTTVMNFVVGSLASDPNFEYVIAALTSDHKVIVAFLGPNATISQFLDLEETSILTSDKQFEAPFFTDIDWVNDACAVNMTSGKLAFYILSPNFYSYLIEVSGNGGNNLQFKILNGFSYFPNYQLVDAKYDTCSNSFVTLNSLREGLYSASCYLMVYPGSATNASKFTIAGDSYSILEIASAKEIPCPYILYVGAIYNERVNTTSLIPFVHSGLIEAYVTANNYAIKITNYSLPMELAGKGLKFVVQAANDFAKSTVSAYVPMKSNKPAPGPDPGPGPSPGPDPKPDPEPDEPANLTWLWVVLGILGLLLVVGVILWCIRRKRDFDEELFENSRDSYISVQRT